MSGPHTLAAGIWCALLQLQKVIKPSPRHIYKARTSPAMRNLLKIPRCEAGVNGAGLVRRIPVIVQICLDLFASVRLCIRP